MNSWYEPQMVISPLRSRAELRADAITALAAVVFLLICCKTLGRWDGGRRAN